MDRLESEILPPPDKPDQRSAGSKFLHQDVLPAKETLVQRHANHSGKFFTLHKNAAYRVSNMGDEATPDWHVVREDLKPDDLPLHLRSVICINGHIEVVSAELAQILGIRPKDPVAEEGPHVIAVVSYDELDGIAKITQDPVVRTAALGHMLKVKRAVGDILDLAKRAEASLNREAETVLDMEALARKKTIELTIREAEEPLETADLQ